MATLNIGMKVNRAITGATTVAANAIAVVTYDLTTVPATVTGLTVGFGVQQSVIRTYGPGQAIPTTFSGLIVSSRGAGGALATDTVTYTLASGFELINTI